jgi:hypothetical protein
MRFEFRCLLCGKIEEISMSLEEYHQKYEVAILHCSCGGYYHRLYNPPVVFGETTVKEQ